MINEEYLSYVDYLKSINFEEKLKILKEKYKDRKVVLFGTGVFLDAILDTYNITEYLNVIGISDKRINEDKPSGYKGFNVYKPLALRALNFSIILDTNILFEDTKKFLQKNYYVKKSIIIEKIIQIPLKEKLELLKNKIYAVFKFLIASKNIFKTIKYSLICTTEEITSKTNYIRKLREIKTNKKPIRTVFICSDVQHTEFVGLYNLLYFDKDFKVFPIIITPDNLLDVEDIDEEKMKKELQIFEDFNTKVIDGIERDTKELACLHAFKPDLIFYQKPIYIKDDFNPAKMSKQALTFSIEYEIKQADFTAIGSKYFRKQVSNLWKVFVNNEDDKNLYSEYTDTQNKNIVKVINKNLNSGIIYFLKKTLNLN